MPMDDTLRWLVLKVQEVGGVVSLRLACVFLLTASERLDRLPLVFAASSNRTIRS